MPARACRGCLATDCRLYNIYKINLYEAFGDVVGSPIFESDDLPQHICSMCLVQLNKFVTFRDRCRLAQDLLEELKMQGVKLTTSFIQKIDRGKCSLLPNLKKFTPPFSDMIIHEEIPEKPPEEEPGSDHEAVEPLSPTDNTDQPPTPAPTEINELIAQDTPLENEPILKMRERKKTKPKHPPSFLSPYLFDSPDAIEKFKETFKVDIVFLTKEEQIEEVKEKILQSATRPGAGPYCSDCGKSCFNEEFLRKHIKECHDESEGTVQCEICRCRFTTKDMIKHLMFHKTKITCNECGYVSKTTRSATNHARIDHGLGPPKTVSCKFCDKVFGTRVLLNDHITGTHSNKLLWCRCCAETFLNKMGRVVHLKRIHGEFLKSRHISLTCEKFNCVMCGEHFETLSLLKEHVIQQHSRSKYIKMAQCSECEVKFFGTEPLVKHLEEMSCGKGVPCQVCGVSFPTKDAMEDHKSEFHIKLYRACEFCDKGFDSDNYRHHILRVHNIKPPSRHMKGIHPRSSRKIWSVQGGIISGQDAVAPVPVPKEKPKRILMCDFCGKTFNKYQYLKIHRFQHTGERPHRCEYCQKGFIRAEALRAHMLLHTGEKPFMCQHCSKLFRTRGALSRHLLTHTGIRRHVCHICNKSFATSNNVKLHIKAVHLNLPVRGPRKREFIAWINKNKQQGNDGTEQGDMDAEQEQGVMDADNSQGIMDSETSAAVAMITGSLDRPNKIQRVDDINTQDLTDANLCTQYFMDSETLRDVPSNPRVQTIKKRGRPKQYLKDINSSARTQNYMAQDNMVTQEYMDNDATQDDMVYDTLSRDITVTAVPRIIKTINVRPRKRPVQQRSMPSLNLDSDTQQDLMDTQVSMDSSSSQDGIGNEQDYMDSGASIQKQVYMDSSSTIIQKQVYMDSGTKIQKQVYMDSSSTNIQKQVYMGSSSTSGGSTQNANSKQIILARQDFGGKKKYVIVNRVPLEQKTKPAPKVNTRIIGWK
ncbi:hypothetical protein ABMA28_012739 [Loxostege sticticalis]|uniref:Uncharacterized protein n=1 Tax=Loxostege sticticalis TaxID=481309 RepID=A0ABD0S4W8_LOXSC